MLFTHHSSSTKPPLGSIFISFFLVKEGHQWPEDERGRRRDLQSTGIRTQRLEGSGGGGLFLIGNIERGLEEMWGSFTMPGIQVAP